LLKKKLVLLIETAAEALAILSDDAPKDENTDQFVRDRAMSFRDLASRYFSLVNVSNQRFRNLGPTNFLRVRV
jgi:hypothetical protein